MSALIADGLFDLTSDMLSKPKPNIKSRADWDALEQWAFCYTATEKGNNSGIRFMVSVEDAQAWCQHPDSKGLLHGTQWAYFWTTVARFIRHYNDFTGTQSLDVEATIDISNLVDNGEWDDRLLAAGVTTKHAPRDFHRVLAPLGVTVTRDKACKEVEA